jgi:hypothetical protein
MPPGNSSRHDLLEESAYARGVFVAPFEEVWPSRQQPDLLLIVSGRPAQAASFFLRGRCSDRVTSGIALIALIAFVTLVPFLALRARRPGVTLRTFEATCESERCDERSYQGQEPHIFVLF